MFFASPGQINAILPYELATNTNLQLVVVKGTTFSLPSNIQIAAAAPSVFTVNQSGSGAGAILNQDGSLNTPSNPAARLSFVSIYCAGLGPVAPPVADGVQVSGLSQIVNQLVVGINNAGAPVTFAGLAPGFVGLYQVNVQVPASTPVGSQIPVQLGVVVSGATFFSPLVSMAVK